MKILKEEDVIRVMREEWAKKVHALSEEVSLHLKAKVDGDEIEPINPGLKIKHSKTGVEFTVVEIGPAFVTLSFEGKEKTISVDELEEDYVLG